MIASKVKLGRFGHFVHDACFLLAVVLLVAGLVIGIQAFSVNVITDTYEYLNIAGGLVLSALCLVVLTRD